MIHIKEFKYVVQLVVFTPDKDTSLKMWKISLQKVEKLHD